MNFKNWLMREMGHVLVRHANDDSKAIDVIDPRSEQYPLHKLPKGMSPIVSYHGRLPNGRIFARRADPITGGEGMILDEPPKWDSIELPDDWWDYADVYYADGSRRKPTKGRDPDLV